MTLAVIIGKCRVELMVVHICIPRWGGGKAVMSPYFGMNVIKIPVTTNPINI